MAARAGLIAALALAPALALVAPAAAHRLAPSLLALRGGAAGRVEVTWKTPLLVPSGTSLAPRLPAHCTADGAPQAQRDAVSVTLRWQVDCGGRGLAGATLGVDGLEASRTDALLHVSLADGRSVRSVLSGARARYTVPERERPRDILRGYGTLGFRHILGGADHLLFVLGLVLLVSGRRALLLAVSAFTVGHSVTLSLAALGFVRFPTDVAELAIAASILLLAAELAAPGAARASLLRRRPWLAAGGFGLVHGLGFAGALAEVGLPAAEIPLALFSFNVGIELGQLAFVAAVLLLRTALAYLSAPPMRRLAPLPAHAMGALAAYWCLGRAAALLV